MAQIRPSPSTPRLHARGELRTLTIQEAIHNEMYADLKTFLASDTEFQEFRRKFLASTGIDPMNPLETE